jgi:hypothetical protein
MVDVGMPERTFPGKVPLFLGKVVEGRKRAITCSTALQAKQIPMEEIRFLHQSTVFCYSRNRSTKALAACGWAIPRKNEGGEEELRSRGRQREHWLAR